jgi:hypothetical protein
MWVLVRFLFYQMLNISGFLQPFSTNKKLLVFIHMQLIAWSENTDLALSVLQRGEHVN